MTKSDLTLRLVKGSNLTFQEGDDNFDRLAYWSSDWVSGSYDAYEVVQHLGVLWVANKTTTETPGEAAVDWDQAMQQCMYWRGDWTSQQYYKNDVAKSAIGIVYVCTADTTDNPDIDDTNWEPISTPVVFGYGGIIGTAKNYAPVNATWQAVDLWDSVNVPNVNTTTNLDGTFSFQQAGWWEMYFYIQATIDEAQGGRVFSVRIYNVTKSEAADAVGIGVGRNVTKTSGVVLPWFNIEADDVDDIFRLEIARTDGQDFNTFTADRHTLRLNQKV